MSKLAPEVVSIKAIKRGATVKSLMGEASLICSLRPNISFLNNQWLFGWHSWLPDGHQHRNLRTYVRRHQSDHKGRLVPHSYNVWDHHI
jgi:hypothetical protein